MYNNAMKQPTRVIVGLLTLFCTTTAFSTEIKMEVAEELEEVLPFTAVDSSGRAVTDLKKPEIVFLVDGINFRGFSLISPGDTLFSGKPLAYPELVKSPPNAYYEILFPYIWDAKQAIRIQLGTIRRGVHLATPKSIQKRQSYRRIEDVKAEILALELIKENSWLNMNLISLNLFPVEMKTGGGKKESHESYSIRLPAEYLKNRIDLFKITFQSEKTDIMIEQQWITPAAAVLQIDKGNETYLLLANRQRMAALALKNIPASGSQQAETRVKLSPEEKLKTVAAIRERQKTLTALLSEVKMIPIQIMPTPLKENASAGERNSQENAATIAPDSQIVKDTGRSGPFPSLQLPDSKTFILSKLESYRSEQSQTAKIHYCDTALKYLKQNQVTKALPWLAKSLDLIPKKNDFATALLKKLKSLDRFQKEILSKSASMSALDLQKKFNYIQSQFDRGLENAKMKDFFNDFQEILDENQARFDFVHETLAKLPEYLEITDLKSSTRNETLGMLSPDPKVPELYKQIENLLHLSSELANKTFIQASWTSRLMNNLKLILGHYVLQADANEQCVQSFPETMAEAAIGFVMANNRAFSKPFKRSFYEKKMRSLGIADEWLKDPSFFNVVIQARAIEKNSKGFWEAAFADDLSMIYIPSGSFTMGVPWEAGGAEDESPPHEVELDSYWIAKNEITFLQYDRFCEDTDRSLPSDYDKGRKKRPVIDISYQNAMDYCQWLTSRTGVLFRLPTEAEWEKVARGSDKRIYPWGNSDPNGSLSNFADVNFLKYFQQTNPPANETERQQMLKWIAETTDDGQIFTAPVGSYPHGASPFGAMDMAGNVWEWVADWYDGNYYQISPRRNPPGSSSGIYRVVRGGGWDGNPWMLRSTSRSGAPPTPNKGSESIGFRTAASPFEAAQPAGNANPDELK